MEEQKYIALNHSAGTLDRALQAAFDDGVKPGQIIGIAVKGNIWHVACWKPK